MKDDIVEFMGFKFIKTTDPEAKKRKAALLKEIKVWLREVEIRKWSPWIK